MLSAMDDEQSLLEQIQNKDMDAFEVLYERLKGHVFTLAYQMLKSKEDAEEVLQDTFAKLYDKACIYKSQRGSVRAFIYTMARNECISRIRKQNVRPQTSNADVAVLNPVSEQQDQLERLYAESAMQVLADEEKHLVQKAFFHGHSHREIASHTGLPLGTVKTKLRQALTRMRQHLETGQES